jgi:arylsulfatase/arylsulfatase A
MTGRYPYRTRAFDTYLGRSMLDPQEVTLAECLRDAGYRTCISGKWHLGDCYPMRAMDNGFEEALVHNGGGLRQPGNVTRNNGYFDPDLMHNGEIEASTGYCTDIFTDHAIEFIEKPDHRPFFLYIGTNCPHAPFEIGEEWVKPYLDMGINETHARVYGMVENIDMNVGRVLQCLDQQGVAENTIVVYTSDHGQCGSSRHAGENRFNSGLRDIKGSIYNGGLQVPSFWRWPAKFPANRAIDRIANPIDVLPTLLDAAGVALPEVKIDGTSLLPLLDGSAEPDDWPDRRIFVQWHRGDEPQARRNACVITQQHKLCWPEGSNAPEVYDLLDDPGEAHDICPDYPDIVERLSAAYDTWFAEVSSTRENNYACPRIVIGSEHERFTVLTRQDNRMDGPDDWGDDALTHWEVEIAEAGDYNIRIRLPAAVTDAHWHLKLDEREESTATSDETRSVLFESVPLNAGPLRVEAWAEAGDRRIAALRVGVSAELLPELV